MSTHWYQKARSRAKEIGLSQYEIASQLGVTPGSVNHYLSGNRQPKPGMLKRLAEILGVSVSELIEDDPSFARNATEHALLAVIRELSPEEQSHWVAVISAVKTTRAAEKLKEDSKPQK